jgi:addiction module HigA family antidote
MPKRRSEPIHPGEILKTAFLDELDVTAYALAKALHVPANRITGIINGERSITADTALRLARFFGTTPTFWLNLQIQYDLAEIGRRDMGRIEQEVQRSAEASAHAMKLIGGSRSRRWLRE